MELPSAKQMKMEMGDSLSGIGTVIGYDPIAAIIEPVIGGDTRCQRQCVRGDVPIAAADIAQGHEVSSRHDEHVDRGLRMEVAEGDVVLALGDELRAKLAPRDAAEYAIGNGRISHLFSHPERFGNSSVVRSDSLQPWPLRRATVVRVCQNCPRSKPSAAP